MIQQVGRTRRRARGLYQDKLAAIGSQYHGRVHREVEPCQERMESLGTFFRWRWAIVYRAK